MKHVSYKQALALKTKGFNLPVHAAYSILDEVGEVLSTYSKELFVGIDYNDLDTGEISAPELEVAVEWLLKLDEERLFIITETESLLLKASGSLEGEDQRTADAIDDYLSNLKHRL